MPVPMMHQEFVRWKSLISQTWLLLTRTGGTSAFGGAFFARRWEHPGFRWLRKKDFLLALRFSSKGFALALRSRGTALTKSSPGCALALRQAQGRAEFF